MQHRHHRPAHLLRHVIVLLAGSCAASPAFAASAPGVEAWSALALFAALVIGACVVVHKGGQRRSGRVGPTLHATDIAAGESG